jgi:dimethylamine monooxygenase subunit A
VASSADAPYLPFLEGPRIDGPEGFRHRLGLRTLDLDQWFELGADAEQAIADKTRLTEAHPDTVFAVLDDVLAEATEASDAIVAHLRRRWPQRYGDAVLDPRLHPLDAAARLVPEDLVLLVERNGGLVFGGGSVCFPNRWDLRSKLGMTMAAVHRPVPLLNEQLEEPIDRFFSRLTPERSYWRLGWNLLDTDDGYTPVDGTAAPRPADPAPADMFLRVERETLRRFPVTGCVLFTIRTHVTPVPVVARRSVNAAGLAAALRAMPADLLEYKSLSGVAASIIDMLSSVVVDPAQS